MAETDQERADREKREAAARKAKGSIVSATLKGNRTAAKTETGQKTAKVLKDAAKKKR